MDVLNPVTADPNESCALTTISPEFREPPPSLIQPSTENRLITVLRQAAQDIERTGDPIPILTKSAVEYFRARRTQGVNGDAAQHLYLAQALADLTVTGRAAFQAFHGRAPIDPDLADSTRAALNAENPPASLPELALCIAETLDRAYEVAAALRGPVWNRMSKRARLGWIAVSGEDDPPHRPVNVPSAPYPQFDLTMTVSGQELTTRYLIATAPAVGSALPFLTWLPQIGTLATTALGVPVGPSGPAVRRGRKYSAGQQ